MFNYVLCLNLTAGGFGLGDVADFKHKCSIEFLMLNLEQMLIEAFQPPYYQNRYVRPA